MTAGEVDRTVFEELKQMSGADFLGELVDTFLDEAPKLIAQLRSAHGAGDAEAFRRAAHSLKSNAATFGANQLAEQARQLELIGKENRLGDAGTRIEQLQDTLGAVATELKRLKV